MRKELDHAIAALREAPTVNIKGKKYTQVATRVEIFRQHFGTDWALVTDILPAEHPFVRARAEIRNPRGDVIATGTAQENSTLGINKTSAIENCETSAIGRALANLGLHGGEYATAEEVDGAIKAQEEIKDDLATKAKTQVESDLRAFDRDLQRVTDLDELAGLLESYGDMLDAARKRADTKGWFKTKTGSDTLGIDDRIATKRAELEKAEREGPAPEGPQETTGSPQNGLTLTWPDGKRADFKATKAGAMDFLSKLEVAAAVNRDTWELNKPAVAWLIDTATDEDVKKRATALERAMEETPLAAGE